MRLPFCPLPALLAVGEDGVCLRALARSQDMIVLIWTVKDTLIASWREAMLSIDPAAGSVCPAMSRLPDVVLRFSWSLTGTGLAVSCGDGKVTLQKENLRGMWEDVSDTTS